MSIDKKVIENLSKQDRYSFIKHRSDSDIQISRDLIPTFRPRLTMTSHRLPIKYSQNDFAAIAAVDYAIRKGKPTCGLAMEF